MKIDDVFADEVIGLGVISRGPVLLEVEIVVLIAVMQEACEITDGRIQPDIKIFVISAGYLEAEIRCIPRNVPVL